MSNRLSLESSLYLQQHKNNPVNWYPWGGSTLSKAKKENKLIVVSIGYSSCHWCHVMERESFANNDVAKIMNEHFVSIKVDREERPDIDQIYMLAVQLMTGQGGWPLNMICLPDGRPVYGGTYFRVEDWKSVLNQITLKWKEEPALLYDYADRLSKGIKENEMIAISKADSGYRKEDLFEIVRAWKESFDYQEGGYARAPKFPLPNNWLFLLRYSVEFGDQDIKKHVHFTLKKIACGGVYDQVGGGFSRYSVDRKWHIPHFEKMLYDNALLVSLYCEAYQESKDPLYKRIVYETLEWVRREMTSTDGAFYSSLDADSEGVEGKYYTYTEDEMVQALGCEADLFLEYFNIEEKGNWEERGTNVLFTDIDADNLAEMAGFTFEEWQEYLKQAKKKLFDYREQRERPTLDKKIICAWNAMMSKAYIDASRVFNDIGFLEIPEKNLEYISEKLKRSDGQLLRYATSTTDTNIAFLDDYAFYIEALIALYEATFNEKWIYEAKEVVDYVIENFYEPDVSAFYYTAKEAEQLIARKFEVMDDVIPSSNSVLIRQLLKLGLIFDKGSFIDLSDKALVNILPQIKSYGSTFSNWAILLLEKVVGSFEVVLIGPEYERLRIELDSHYIPNKALIGGRTSTLPLARDRRPSETLAFICQNKTCSLPVKSIEELLKLIIKPEA